MSAASFDLVPNFFVSFLSLFRSGLGPSAETRLPKFLSGIIPYIHYALTFFGTLVLNFRCSRFSTQDLPGPKMDNFSRGLHSIMLVARNWSFSVELDLMLARRQTPGYFISTFLLLSST